MNKPFQLEHLERRQLLAAVYPTAVEQLEVELINRARANPATEAARFGLDLNEGLPRNTISPAAKPPLAISPFLIDAARKHSRWMLDVDMFSHTGSGGSNPGKRMTSAGYAFDAPWTWGENIGYRSQKPGVPNPVTTAAQIHQDLFIDRGIAGRGHRVNMLNDGFKEIGAGVVSGDFKGFNAVMLTTDFAASGAGSFLTGVAYTDALVKDNFYTPGEGLGGVTVEARRVGDGKLFSTLTWSSGGYSLKLSPGTYAVSGSGGGLGATVSYGNVVIASRNLKVDFKPAPVPSPAPPTGAGSIKGVVFNDLNRNGKFDSGETLLSGVMVYIDANRNGRRDAAEPFVRTYSNGAFRLSGLPAGTYRIRHIIPPGYAALSPASGFHEVKLSEGRAVGGRDFADVAATP